MVPVFKLRAGDSLFRRTRVSLGICVLRHMCGGQRTLPGVRLFLTLLKQGLLASAALCTQTSWPSSFPVNSLVLPPISKQECRGYRRRMHICLFYVGSGLKLRPCDLHG